MKFRNKVKTATGALAANLFGVRKPLNVTVSVTNRCTAHCRYCRIPERVQREMTTAELKSLIDQAADLGTQRLGLWGGEPLIRDDIGELVHHAAARGLYVTIDTNGHLLPQKIDAIAEAGHLMVALDGDRAAHDSVRGPGTFDLALAGLRAAIPRVPTWTLTVLARHSLDQIDFLLDLARREGTMCMFQVIYHNEKLGGSMEPFLPTNEAYRQAVQKLIDAKRHGAPIASSIPYLKRLLRWPDYATPLLEERLGGLRCWAGDLFCNIDTDGTVYPCSLLVGMGPGENFLKVGLKAAFDATRGVHCQACDAACYTEYNYLYRLSPRVVMSWLRAMHRTQKTMRRRAAQ